MNLRTVFLAVCIPVRFVIPLLLQIYVPREWKVFCGFLCLGAGLGFINQFIADAPGYFSGEQSWWNLMRPFHGLLYLLAALALVSKEHQHLAPIFLYIDVLLGLSTFASRSSILV